MASRDQRAYLKAYREKNRERCLQKQRGWYLRNKPRLSVEWKAKWAAKSPEEKRRVSRMNRLRDVDLSRKLSRAAYHRNKHRRVTWAKLHPEQRRVVARNYQRRLRATPRGRLNLRMSASIRRALTGRKGGRRWESMVGYSVEDLAKHIESKFQRGMSWDKLMNGEIEIDHVIPKSKFTYSNPEDLQFRQCWAMENLAPMWAADNRRKKAKLEKHEQIALGI